MTDVTITPELMREISDITAPHLKSLNEELTKRWPDTPDMHLTLAIGWQVSVLLGSLSNPSERMNAADGITALVHHIGFALTPNQ